MRTILVWLLVSASCDGSTKSREPTRPPAVAPTPATPSGPDITVLPGKTTASGVVLAIGKPPLHVTDQVSQIVVRSVERRAFAIDRETIKVWELDRGTLVEHIELPLTEKEPSLTIAVSRDARWLAIDRAFDSDEVRLAPFTATAFRVAATTPHAFSADGTFLVGHALNVATIVDIAQQKIVATSPEPAKRSLSDKAVAQHGEDVYWIRDIDLLRWNRTTNKLDVVTVPRTPWKTAEIAMNAPIGVVTDARGTYRLDLATGTTTPILSEFTRFAVSPTGERVGLTFPGELRVLETKSRKQLASIKLATGVESLAYSEDDNVLAYVADQRIHIHDLVGGPRIFAEPSRFRRWLAAGVAAIARDAKLEQLTVDTRASAPIDASAIATTPPADAPTWATWIEVGPNGVVAAEASPRSLLPGYRRADEACAPKLRVWTAKGGERTFTREAGDADAEGVSAVDPCWQLSGGYVIAVTLDGIEIYSPTTGKRIAQLAPGKPPEWADDPKLAHHYWAVAASPTGKHLALWWRRADVWAPEQPEDPRRDVLHIAEGHTKPECEDDRQHQCKREYVAEVWSLAKTPKRIWQHRPDSKSATSRTWPLPKLATTAIAFTHDGKHVLFGFEDGDVMIRAVDSAEPMRVESLHRAPVDRIEIAPGDGHVFSEDRAGEQRIWPLARP